MDELEKLLENAGMPVRENDFDDEKDPMVAVSIMAQSCATIRRLEAEGLAHAAMQQSGDEDDIDYEQIEDITFNSSGTIDVTISAHDSIGDLITLDITVDGARVRANW